MSIEIRHAEAEVNGVRLHYAAAGSGSLVMFVHGWRHVKAVQSGPGMANWLESLGLRNGPLQAQLLTWSEVFVGPVLALVLRCESQRYRRDVRLVRSIRHLRRRDRLVA